MNNEQLTKIVLELQEKVRSLEQSSSISYGVENAFIGRGFPQLTAVPSDGFVLPLTFNLTGGAETIQTAPFPEGYMPLVSNQIPANTYFVPVYVANV